MTPITPWEAFKNWLRWRTCCLLRHPLWYDIEFAHFGTFRACACGDRQTR